MLREFGIGLVAIVAVAAAAGHLAGKERSQEHPLRKSYFRGAIQKTL